METRYINSTDLACDTRGEREYLAGGESPLEVAVQLGRIDALKMLLTFRHININARSGDPPLYEAVEKGALEAVQLLVRQGEQKSMSAPV